MCVQYSPDWWELRRGIPTASSFDKIITPGGKPSTQAEGLIDELVGDLVDMRPNAFSERGRMGTPEMEAGRAAEPQARSWYALQRNMDVQEVGFCLHDSGLYGCSPDGLVGEEGGLELKCPLPKTHAGYVRRGGLPLDYKPQVHGSLVVTGRKWWDFMSYMPGLPPHLVRIEPDDYTKALADALAAFLAKYSEALAKFGLKIPKR